MPYIFTMAPQISQTTVCHVYTKQIISNLKGTITSLFFFFVLPKFLSFISKYTDCFIISVYTVFQSMHAFQHRFRYEVAANLTPQMNSSAFDKQKQPLLQGSPLRWGWDTLLIPAFSLSD